MKIAWGSGFLVLSVLIIFGCVKKNETSQKELFSQDENSARELFSLKKNDETGIHFKNLITESRNLNGVLYEYLYNGGGVAVSDFNNDNLKDIYFISNLESNQLYLNKGDLKFEEVTKTSNVNGGKGFPTGVTVVDINADGKMDIYVCKSGRFSNPEDRRNQLFINKGNNKEGIPIFKEEAKKYGLDLPHFSTQASFFDYDKDGDLDMFIINHGIKSYEDDVTFNLLNSSNQFQSSRLFKNENGFYSDVSEQSGIINNALSFGLGIAIGDLNNDTWPDVLIGHDFAEKDHLYLNQKNGTFKEVIKEATNQVSYFSMGNDISDFNNDGWLDFVTVDMMSEHNYDIKTSMSGMNPKRFYELTEMGLHYQYMFNTLQQNNGIKNKENNIPVFSNIAQMNGLSSTDWSWSPLVFDMDNDGWKDIFISNGIKRDFRNNDFIKYKASRFAEFFKKNPQNTRESKQKARGLIMELIKEMPTRHKPNYFFQNKKGNGFVKNKIWGGDYPTSSNGAAYADLDNDGDLDIVINNTDDFAMIYENNSTDINSANYLNIKLKGSNKNRNGIGARVIISKDKEIQIQENYFTRGFQSSSSGDLHFGVGNKNSIDKIKVIWADNKVSTIDNVEVNKTIEIDYKSAKNEDLNIGEPEILFKDISNSTNLSYKHTENNFDDFERESLLPHRMSQLGPALATTDLNDDGLDDVYVGGAQGQAGKLYFQQKDGTFQEKRMIPFNQDKQYEDVSALFFDADGDGDADLYVVSGGNEALQDSKNLEDRLYENIGNGNFKKTKALPSIGLSGSKVKAADFDNDGDLDLFVGGRQKPGHYPEPVSSIILKNNSKSGKIEFSNATNDIAKSLGNIGMVTDAIWLDVDKDDWLDLMIVGEWMAPVILKNNQGTFEDISSKSGLSEETGWWFSLSLADFDGDGDQDIIAGNLGLNYKYKATKKEPFEVFQRDFDKNGELDIVLGYYDLGTLYPLRGRECSSNQIPSIKEKFKNYHAFGEASLIDVYGDDNLNNAVHYKVVNFATSYFENNGDGTFKVRSLNQTAQFSSVNAINIDDFDGDGNLDVVLSGNWYVSEVETPRNDASFGVFLKGDGKGAFKEISSNESGLYIKGDVRNAEIIQMNNEKTALLVAKNNDVLQIIEVNPIVNKDE